MGAVAPAERQRRAVAVLERRKWYQWGQKKADAVGNSGCADTNIQLIVRISKGKDVSLNKVRERTGAARGKPTLNSQARKGLASFGLAYDFRSDLDAAGVVNLARARGPVFVCYKYWSHPQWEGYKYAGKTLNGRAPNNAGKFVTVGFAKPKRQAGLTQWNFRGGHSCLVVGRMQFDGETYAIVRDPNHNSPARPERPAYDLVSYRQLNKMLNSWGTSRLVLAPRVASSPPNVQGGNQKPKASPKDDPEDERWLDPVADEEFVMGGVGGAINMSTLGVVGLVGAILAGAAIVLLGALGAQRIGVGR